jgi:hypothetical protein
VTQTSQNTYADRAAIAERYASDPLLRDSQFWYHAELFETGQLKGLLADAEIGLNLAPMITAIEARKLALLCYYFFYPAHEESLASVCTNVEAKEFGSCAGEWSCLAVLLEKTGNLAYTPTLIGFTGREGSPPGPEANDPRAASHRMPMRIAPWAAATKVGQHPKLFVSKGTHSLYLDPGDGEGKHLSSEPHGLWSFDCGRSESYPREDPTLGEDILSALKGMAKMFGVKQMVPGQSAAGAVWWITELATDLTQTPMLALQTKDPVPVFLARSCTQ